MTYSMQMQSVLKHFSSLYVLKMIRIWRKAIEKFFHWHRNHIDEIELNATTNMEMCRLKSVIPSIKGSENTTFSLIRFARR